MKKLLITLLLLALTQGVAHTTYAREAEASQHLSAKRAHVAHEQTRTTQEPALTAGPIQAHTPVGGADLERAFWICDYAATTQGVSATPADVCGAIYEQLKNTKFDGDFNRLLLWWKGNKPVEHQKIAREHLGGTVIEPVDRP